MTADAAHTCADTARYLAGDCHADYLLTIKGNRASLHAAAITTGRDLVAAEPGHIAEERGHGRINRWTTWTTHTDPTVWARIGLPHATRLAVIRRDVADLAAAEISAHTRRHWGIENLEHRPRDTIWREDDQHAHHGNGPRATATLRNLALGLLAIHGITKIKQAVQSIGRNPLRAVPLIT